MPMPDRPHRKPFAEFFAGIGLVRAGLEVGGWQCTYANDVDPKKKEMYEGHFGPSPEYDLGDIWDADRVLSHLREDVVLATASFPCTDLSLAGHWKGLSGKHSSTFFAFLAVLDRLGRKKPPIVLLENVVGLLTSHDGNDFRRVCESMAELGYWLDAVVLDAKYFVPQSRPRVFIVGVKKHLRHVLPRRVAANLFAGSESVDPDLLRPAVLTRLMGKTSLQTGWLNSGLPSPPERQRALRSILEEGPHLEWWTEKAVSEHLSLMQAPSRARIEALMDSRAVHLGTAFRRTRLGKTRTEVRFDLAGCLRTPKGGSARQIVVQVSRNRVNMRWMTAREYARLQGADDFKISVPEQQAMYGFGDAVCVPAIAWIDQHILTPLADAHLGHVAAKGQIAV